ncbi:hypothetical protein PFISCL1PPCAC_5510, partial [Pristionchus fissidentatus]
SFVRPVYSRTVSFHFTSFLHCRPFSSQMGRCPEKHKRNERERTRVHQVNLGFERLRHTVRISDDKKLSKAETLRIAVRYIEHLKEMLENGRKEKIDFHFSPSSSTPSHCFPTTQPNFPNYAPDPLKSEKK